MLSPDLIRQLKEEDNKKSEALKKLSDANKNYKSINCLLSDIKNSLNDLSDIFKK